MDPTTVKVNWKDNSSKPDKGIIVLLKFKGHYSLGYYFIPHGYNSKTKEWYAKRGRWMFLNGYEVVESLIIAWGVIQLPMIYSSPEERDKSDW